MTRVLLLDGPGRLRYEDLPPSTLGPRDVRIRTRLGAISAGTEAAWYFGTDPQLDPSFREGRLGRPEFPKTLGYEKCGEVVAVGAEVTGMKVGDRVVAHFPHADSWTLSADAVIPVPAGVSDTQAVMYSLATVALHGVRRSGLRIGDDLMVTGLGFVGLLTVRFARLAGAGRIVATDLYARRRDLGLAMGADLALDPVVGDVGNLLAERFGRGAFDVAIETSSSFEALSDGLRSLRRNGRMCVVSQLKGPYPRHPVLGVEFHLDELEMVTADGRGDVDRLASWYFGALRRGALVGLEDLVTHRVPFTEIERGYRLTEEDPEHVVKILVTYD
jgi:2-desacetyl-2-hydroxyethyl bacteriochlorophyllide A dehydrogenase